MGYCPPQTTYRIVCGDGPHAGLEVAIQAMPLGKYVEIAGAVEGAEFAAVLGHLADMADALVSWNVEDKAGEPVSADLPGLLTQEYGFALYLMGEWIAAVGQIPTPPADSDQPELPMDVLEPA